MLALRSNLLVGIAVSFEQMFCRSKHILIEELWLCKSSGSLAMLLAIRLALSCVNKLRRHLGFPFVDNKTATSCCHGSVLYSGSIFCEI
jgi:hypothetical protein